MERSAAQMQVTGNLLDVTSRPGWRNVEQFAAAVLQGLKDKAFMEEDQTKAEGLRRDARGAMLFWKELIQSINITKNLDAEPTADNFLDVATD